MFCLYIPRLTGSGESYILKVNGFDETRVIPKPVSGVNMVSRSYIKPYSSGDVITVASASGCFGCQVSLTMFTLSYMMSPGTPAFYVGLSTT